MCVDIIASHLHYLYLIAVERGNLVDTCTLVNTAHVSAETDVITHETQALTLPRTQKAAGQHTVDNINNVSTMKFKLFTRKNTTFPLHSSVLTFICLGVSPTKIISTGCISIQIHHFATSASSAIIINTNRHSGAVNKEFVSKALIRKPDRWSAQIFRI